MLRSFDRLIAPKAGYAMVPLRIVFFWRCVIPVLPYLTGTKTYDKFVGLLASLHFPAPEFFARLSIYAQILCAIFILAGFLTRPFALIAIIHFAIIVMAAHLGDPIVTSFPAWALLAMSVTFFLAGGGELSIDRMRDARARSLA